MAIGRTIGRAAEQAGVGIETIRFYDQRGLIGQPVRPRGGGYRFYDDDVIERTRFVRQAQELGFSLREIADLLSLRADRAADCRAVRAQAATKREEAGRKIVQLRHIRGALGELIASCPGGGALRACTIIDALTRGSNKVTSPSAAAIPRSRAGSSDQPRTAKGSDVKTTTFKIEGMHCDGCAQTIQALVTMASGVHAADVSFKDGRARILYEPQIVTEDQLVRMIEKGGFRVPARYT